MSDETLRQKISRKLYPVIRKMGKGKLGKEIVNTDMVAPKESFYDLSVTLNSGKDLDFSQFKGKKVLLVNTASNCGYTGQYSELQKLYEQLDGKLAIVGFPANDFGEQEKGDDSEIAEFCQVNYGVEFPIAEKSVVIQDDKQNEVYQWLTKAERNGWNDHSPEWNFSKYLVDEDGVLTHYFGSSISPLDENFIELMK